MNTDNLARSTFVLDRSTADQLAFISRRMGVSRSALVRDVLAEPVALMATWVRSLPDDPQPSDAARLEERMQLDLAGLIDRKMTAVGGAGHE